MSVLRLVSGNFRRLNMKGKRYLRAPNTSAASVRRRRWAHKNERRMLDRSEHGYGGMEELPDESAAAAAAVAGANGKYLCMCQAHLHLRALEGGQTS